LAAFVAGEFVALDVATEPLGDEVIGQPPRTVGHLPPSQPPIAIDDAGLVRAGCSDRFVNEGHWKLTILLLCHARDRRR